MMSQVHRNKPRPRRSGLLALSPLLLFILLFLGLSLAVNDFYKIPILMIFVIAAIYAIITTRGVQLSKRIAIFSRGAGNEALLLMVWIFVLAGAFAESAKALGAIDATVGMTLQIMPPGLLLAGLFVAACLISLAVGTSVGTIAALIPIATGIAQQTHVDIHLLTAIIVGGAFFGDNLSFISDTTIVASRTQGCNLNDKFKANFRIVLPAALIVTGIYVYIGMQQGVQPDIKPIEWFKILPYVVVLVTAILGVNVLLVLTIGCTLIGGIGLLTHSLSIEAWLMAMGQGVKGMGELIIISMLAGGLLELIRYNGGITYLIKALTKRIRSKRGAELGIAALVSMANLCTANNTIAILSVGGIAHDIAQKYGVDRRKSASILDTFSCFVQGIIPYGAQLLIASGLAGISPLGIIPYLYYPFVMACFALSAIWFRWPRQYA